MLAARQRVEDLDLKGVETNRVYAQVATSPIVTLCLVVCVTAAKQAYQGSRQHVGKEYSSNWKESSCYLHTSCCDCLVFPVYDHMSKAGKAGSTNQERLDNSSKAEKLVLP